MDFPDDRRYTKEHEWVKLADETTIVIGITDFAQGELGDVVFVELEDEGSELSVDEMFGTVEAVKTVSDLFMPVSGTIADVNEALDAGSVEHQVGLLLRSLLVRRHARERATTLPAGRKRR